MNQKHDVSLGEVYLFVVVLSIAIVALCSLVGGFVVMVLYVLVKLG